MKNFMRKMWRYVHIYPYYFEAAKALLSLRCPSQLAIGIDTQFGKRVQGYYCGIL